MVAEGFVMNNAGVVRSVVGEPDDSDSSSFRPIVEVDSAAGQSNFARTRFNSDCWCGRRGRAMHG